MARSQTIKTALLVLFLCCIIKGKAIAAGDLWALHHIPLPLLAAKDPPNIFVTMDDSCSMWVEHIIPYGETDDVGQYNHAQTFMNGVDRTNGASADHLMNFPSSYFNAFDFGNTRLIHMFTHLMLHYRWYRIDWRRLSPNVFELYYDPSKTYEPWQGFPQANFNAARFWAHPDSPGYSDKYNLNANGHGFHYFIHFDTKSRSAHGSNWKVANNSNPETVPHITNDPDPAITVKSDPKEIDIWDDYIQYTITNSSMRKRHVRFNVPALNRGGGDPDPNEYDCVAETSYKNFDPPYADCLGATVIASTNPTTVYGRTLAQEKQNIANWFVYHRHHLTRIKNALINVMDARPDFNWGGQLMVDNGDTTMYNTNQNQYINGGNEKTFEPIPVPNNNRAAQTQKVKNALVSANHASYCVTPTMNATYRASEYFKNSVNYQRYSGGSWNTHASSTPVTSACQHNFHLLLTDGVWTTPIRFNAVGDVNNDGYSDTLSDVALDYYQTDLFPTLDNLVPTTSFNENNQQHVSHFILGIGFEKPFTDLDDDGWPDTDLETYDWWGGISPNDSNYNIAFNARVRDHWHAAYASRGAMISSNDPADALIDAFEKIDARAVGRFYGAAAAARGTSESPSSIISTQFDSDTFETDLIIQNLDNVGNFDGDPIEKQLIVKNHAARLILSGKPSTPSFQGIVFKAGGSGLTNAQKAVMTPTSVDPSVDTSYVSDLINYVRGDQSQEGTSGSRAWRERSSILGASGQVAIGATSHSNLVYIGPPANIYGNWNNHDTFVSSRSSRKPMIYFGANDGMLHAFDPYSSANESKEVMAYVPNGILDKLHNLTQTDPTTSTAFVDGQITVRDYYNGSQWRTLLVSGLRTGGQGYFALDITEPENFNTANTTNIVKWEFSDQDDADLGFTSGTPVISYLNNNTWGVVFGNGYNNTDANAGTNTSSSGNAVIYILNADTGALIKKFDTGVGKSADPAGLDRPNGITDVSLINTFAGGNISDYQTDLIYAGDLFGNVWKIDISDPNPLNWDFALSGQPLISVPAYDDPDPLIPPDPTSIVAPPVATYFDSKDPRKGILVYVGTGRYMIAQDSETAHFGPNYFLALWDYNDHTINLTDLVKQTTNSSGTHGDFELRFTSNNPVEYFDESGNVNKKGWYFELSRAEGEHITGKAIANNQDVTFSTFMPKDDECSAGGSSFLMRLDAKTGGPTNSAFFDLDGNSELTNIDKNPLALSSELSAPSGIRKLISNAGHNNIFHENFGGGADQIYSSDNDGAVRNVRVFTNPNLEGQDSFIRP